MENAELYAFNRWKMQNYVPDKGINLAVLSWAKSIKGKRH